ncbi:MAG: 50S ribosomal protein L1 [Armatimonadetes bacterium]|nr:50S ribosomal protein L1 [Armatimonadota bacterium]
MRKNIRKAAQSPRYVSAAGVVEKGQYYPIEEAIALVKKSATAKFPENIDLAVRLGIDPRKSDQNVRGTTALPHGTGKKEKKIAVLAKGDHVKEAEEAGADVVGSDDLITKIQGGFKDFDIVIATEEMAPSIGKIGRILGPRTPNKRNGTVTNQVGQAIREIKGATRAEYRADKAGIVHMCIGRVTLDDAKIQENLHAALHALIKAKPQTAKGRYLISVTLSSTMGPGVKLDPTVAHKFAS